MRRPESPPSIPPEKESRSRFSDKPPLSTKILDSIGEMEMKPFVEISAAIKREFLLDNKTADTIADGLDYARNILLPQWKNNFHKQIMQMVQAGEISLTVKEVERRLEDVRITFGPPLHLPKNQFQTLIKKWRRDYQDILGKKNKYDNNNKETIRPSGKAYIGTNAIILNFTLEELQKFASAKKRQSEPQVSSVDILDSGEKSAYKLYAHEMLHLLAGQTWKKSIFVINAERTGLEHTLPYHTKEKNVDQPEFNRSRFMWLNEAITEGIAQDMTSNPDNHTVDLFKNIDQSTYRSERQLLQYLVDKLGIDQKLLIDAYFENFNPKAPAGERLPAFKKLTRYIGEKTGHSNFLMKIEHTVKEKGAVAALEQAKRMLSFHKFIR